MTLPQRYSDILSVEQLRYELRLPEDQPPDAVMTKVAAGALGWVSEHCGIPLLPTTQTYQVNRGEFFDGECSGVEPTRALEIVAGITEVVSVQQVTWTNASGEDTTIEADELDVQIRGTRTLAIRRANGAVWAVDCPHTIQCTRALQLEDPRVQLAYQAAVVVAREVRDGIDFSAQIPVTSALYNLIAPLLAQAGNAGVTEVRSLQSG